MDHILGLPAWASQRQLNGIPGGRVYVPPSIAGGVAELLATCARLEGGKPYDVEVIPVAPGEVRPLRRGFELRFFATSHWVETLGCCVEWVRHRLRPELRRARAGRSCSGGSAAGETITEEVRTPLVAYLADTGPEVFAAEPWLAEVEVLVVECTFLRPVGARARAPVRPHAPRRPGGAGARAAQPPPGADAPVAAAPAGARRAHDPHRARPPPDAGAAPPQRRVGVSAGPACASDVGRDRRARTGQMWGATAGRAVVELGGQEEARAARAPHTDKTSLSSHRADDRRMCVGQMWGATAGRAECGARPPGALSLSSEGKKKRARRARPTEQDKPPPHTV